MEIEKEYKEYLINSRIKSIHGRINLIEAEGYSEESIEDLQHQISVLTNLLEML